MKMITLTLKVYL